MKTIYLVSLVCFVIVGAFIEMAIIDKTPAAKRGVRKVHILMGAIFFALLFLFAPPVAAAKAIIAPTIFIGLEYQYGFNTTW